MNNIIDPSDNQAYSIHSKNGKRLLKNYIKFYNTNMNTQTGGSEERNVHPTPQQRQQLEEERNRHNTEKAKMKDLREKITKFIKTIQPQDLKQMSGDKLKELDERLDEELNKLNQSTGREFAWQERQIERERERESRDVVGAIKRVKRDIQQIIQAQAQAQTNNQNKRTESK